LAATLAELEQVGRRLVVDDVGRDRAAGVDLGKTLLDDVAAGALRLADAAAVEPQHVGAVRPQQHVS
jgi:hypothetical protein